MEGDTARMPISTSRGTGPRLYHKKSKNGCQRCRRRRVKCDENRPVCRGCNRHRMSCVYEDNFRHTPPKRHGSQPDQSNVKAPFQEYLLKTTDLSYKNSSGPHTDNPGFDPVDLPEPPESTQRRLLELRLLHHFVTQTCSTFSGAQRAFVRDIWAISVPKLANSHPALLYALLSASALHLLRQAPDELQLEDAYRTYYVLALQRHRSAIKEFEDSKDADASWFTSILIFLNAFAILQDRVIEDPYEPPMAWLHVTHGARKVFQYTVSAVENDPTAGAHAMLQSIPAIVASASSKQTASCSEFPTLLFPVRSGNMDDDPSEEDSDLENEEIREAYTKTVAFLGLVRMAIARNDHVQDICRWLMAFPTIVPAKMIELIKARRPRALVILAHFFALVGSQDGAIEAIWWVGRIARREIEGIQKSLSAQWQPLLTWPLSVVMPASEVHT